MLHTDIDQPPAVGPASDPVLSYNLYYPAGRYVRFFRSPDDPEMP